MAKAGAEVTLVYLTAGEAARDTGYTPEELAKVRRVEAKAAGDTLARPMSRSWTFRTAARPPPIRWPPRPRSPR